MILFDRHKDKDKEASKEEIILKEEVVNKEEFKEDNKKEKDNIADLELTISRLRMRNNALELSLEKSLNQLKRYELYVKDISWRLRDTSVGIDKELEFLKNPDKKREPPSFGGGCSGNRGF